MKVSEAIKILAMFSPNTEVELNFPNASKTVIAVKPGHPPKLPMEGEVAMMPMYPSEQEWYEKAKSRFTEKCVNDKYRSPS